MKLVISSLDDFGVVRVFFVTLCCRLRLQEDKIALQQRQVTEQYRICAQNIKDKILKDSQELLRDVSCVGIVVFITCSS